MCERYYTNKPASPNSLFLLSVDVLLCPSRLLLSLFSLLLSLFVLLYILTIETSVFTSCVPFKKTLFIRQSAGV